MPHSFTTYQCPNYMKSTSSSMLPFKHSYQKNFPRQQDMITVKHYLVSHLTEDPFNKTSFMQTTTCVTRSKTTTGKHHLSYSSIEADVHSFKKYETPNMQVQQPSSSPIMHVNANMKRYVHRKRTKFVKSMNLLWPMMDPGMISPFHPF